MENAGYTTLTRQSGLKREMQVVANNIANAATTGFKQEGLLFSEYIMRSKGGDSLSMASARVAETSLSQGELTKTGNAFDLAIEGDGFFMVQTPDGNRLTRAGMFTPDAQGNLVTADGHPVLDLGETPVFVPAGDGPVSIAPDGTISANGQPLGQIGIFAPVNPREMIREGSVLFRSEAGSEPVEEARVIQGFLEASNVDPISQLARMIEVQRAYEMGQSFMDAEDERIRTAMKTLIK
ncbi:flagellar hook-basal body complex protein [Primorskyibacter flagellatus]|uniref:Flagellar basal-body rod protein FlgF n=1 Tax=Primorskyibacter flagellatus TaxID=1387277 RepID=A0A1W2A9F0_9RHOB|nr:flagellar hook-basal body complex protein [Primorskyibacter flagellatus]SMC56888.1 flagellar basal-body rod protein FlgF [Primorskyibacter flagellatus]